MVTADQFEAQRRHLTTVAYSMLGSMAEAEDAVQDAWLRLYRADQDAIRDLRGWLTTVVGRLCLDRLRSRQARREDHVGTWLPEPVVERVQAANELGPEHEAEVADSIGMALLVVLETLAPPERLAFVLHDVFGLPFDEIGRVVERSPEAARQLASRARRRVRAAPQPDPDVGRQRRVVDAFLAAARSGSFDALVKVMAPDVVFRFDVGANAQGAMPTLEGVEAVARHVLATAPRFISFAKPVLVNGAAGAAFGRPGRLRAVVGFTVVHGLIATIDLVADPVKLERVQIGP